MKQAIFKGENKIYLDGRDGYKYNWDDLRIEPKECFCRQMSRDFIIVWAALTLDGLCDLQGVSGFMNCKIS